MTRTHLELVLVLLATALSACIDFDDLVASECKRRPEVCAGAGGSDAGEQDVDAGSDAGPSLDAGLTDAGLTDAGTSDAGSADAGFDAGASRDGGSLFNDAGLVCTGRVCWLNPLPLGGFDSLVLLSDGGVHATSGGVDVLYSGGAFSRFTDSYFTLGVGEDLYFVQPNRIVRQSPQGESVLPAVDATAGGITHSADGSVWQYGPGLLKLLVAGNWAAVNFPTAAQCPRPNGVAFIGQQLALSCGLDAGLTRFFEVGVASAPRVFLDDFPHETLAMGGASADTLFVSTLGVRYKLSLDGGFSVAGAGVQSAYFTSSDHQVGQATAPPERWLPALATWQQFAPSTRPASGVSFDFRQSAVAFAWGGGLAVGSAAGTFTTLTRSSLGNELGVLTQLRTGQVAVLNSSGGALVTATGLISLGSTGGTVNAFADLPDGRLVFLSNGALAVTRFDGGLDVQPGTATRFVTLDDGGFASVGDPAHPGAVDLYSNVGSSTLVRSVELDAGTLLDVALVGSGRLVAISSSAVVLVDPNPGASLLLTPPPGILRRVCGEPRLDRAYIVTADTVWGSSGDGGWFSGWALGAGDFTDVVCPGGFLVTSTDRELRFPSLDGGPLNIVKFKGARSLALDAANLFVSGDDAQLVTIPIQ